MRPHNRLATLLLCAFPLSVSALDDLEPPDVDFFTTLQGTRTDVRDLGGDHSDGARLTLGTWMNELRTGNLQFALESSFNWMGESESSRSFPDTIVVDGDGQTVEVDVDETISVDINGLSVGTRVLHDEAVYLRGGAVYYNARLRNRQQRTREDNGEEEDFGTVTDTERATSIAPYLGVGFEAPIGDTNISLKVDYSFYRVESERVGSAAIGLNYQIQ